MKTTLIGGVADVAAAFSFWTHLLFDSGNVINSALAMGVAYLLFWETLLQCALALAVSGGLGFKALLHTSTS